MKLVDEQGRTWHLVVAEEPKPRPLTMKEIIERAFPAPQTLRRTA